MGPSMDQNWQAEDDLRMMKKHRMLMSSPKRLKAAKKLAKKESEALEEIAEGKALGHRGEMAENE